MSTGRPDTPLRLIADIGGTNARFALLEGMRYGDECVVACADYPDVVSAIEHYLSQVNATAPGKRPREGAVAIAGPITGDFIQMTNHAWKFSAARVRAQLGLSRLIFLNDFTALAMALRHLPAHELEAIGGGRAVADAPLALLGPGTGLGVSGLIPFGEHWIPLQGEGGHTTLPAMTEREMAVLRQLHQRFSHVSAERVITGPGLVNLYEALCALERRAPEKLTPQDITRRAGEGSCAVCLETVSMFCALLGTVAGNLVLTLGAAGGLYIGGGVLSHFGPLFNHAAFRDRFADKGRYAEYLSGVPVYLIRSELPAFTGLARSFVDPGPRLEAD